MSVPKKRRSKSRAKRARAHKGLNSIKLVKRQGSDELTRPHVASAATGLYKGRQVINVEKRAARAERKRKRGG